MKKSIFFLVLLVIFFVFSKTVIASNDVCTVQVTGTREGQPIAVTINFGALSSGKTYNIVGYDPQNNIFIENSGMKIDHLPYVLNYNIPNTTPGNYNVRVIDPAGHINGVEECFGSTIISAAPVPGAPGIPGKISSPKDWLSTINPGFGAVGPNLGANFGINFFTNNVANFVVSLALFTLFTTSLIFLMIGGIKWITSGGDKEGMAKAKNTVTYAIIGLALGLLSFVLVNILGTFFNLNLVGP